MKQEDKDFILEAIDCEGFDYFFRFHSHFHIKDEKFQELVKNYVESANNLQKYLEN